MTESNRRNLFLALCALALLQTGAHISQSYVNYPTWHLIEGESFKPYHLAITVRSIVFLLAPRFLEIVLSMIVLRFRPSAINRWVILVGVGLAVAALLATAFLSQPLHAQLDIQSNTHLWQHTYKGHMTEIFEIQEEVAKSIVEGLHIKLSKAEEKRVLQRGTDSVEAYEAFLRGAEYYDSHTREGFLKSRSTRSVRAPEALAIRKAMFVATVDLPSPGNAEIVPITW